MTLGFIGLGEMGRGVAANLLKGEEPVMVWNRSPGPVAALVAKGAVEATSVRAVFASSIVFSMLARDEAVEAVILEDGVLDAAAPGLIHVNLATVSVDLARRLDACHRDRGQLYLSAPVLGRPDAAAAGALNLLLAGAPEAREAALPYLSRISKAVFTLGDAPESASVVKLACNFALASMIETLGEAGALVSAYGVEPKALFEVMTSTLFAAPAYRTYADLIAKGSFSPPGFSLPLGLKDIRLALAAGEAERTPLPFASVLRDHFIEAIAAGDGDKDWSALAAGAFRRSGRPL
jgi:3-hydroxyisobutyrate dehydrogenase-like beta-hydroxyacid dehydrogenase